MNGEDYKRAVDGIEPAPGMEERLKRGVLAPPRKSSRKPAAVAAAGIALLLAAGIWLNLPGGNREAAVSPPGETADPGSSPAATGSVYLPKIELPEGNGAGVSMKMIGLFVYKGKIYTQTDTRIPPENAKALLGEKLGRTKGNIDEWSSQDDYAAEFASSIGEMDIYTVKGYDSGFRLMAYQEQDGQVRAELYENLNDRTLAAGVDLFQYLKLPGNVEAAFYLPYESWNNSVEELIPFTDKGTLSAFVEALNTAKPLPRNPFLDADIYDNGADQAFLRLRLQDHTEVQLRLFKEGYVSYGFADVFFQVDSGVFEQIWNGLQALQ